ncbi:hypothetical protein SAMN06297251_10160 [Fulvimarina manganoxydans]|uniref:Homeodomain-like domain-containing protein n=1 Tax=Fulvimarina manganoxydans TaxID=937218 RepID=A0A1W1Y8V6_9HYPH|nr:hypothetical protein [Fulvimarina manganoxydans]SMC32640.1 hypothetical protein SAMN06297251_10160 [Fulvimarina manganoxydans]
MKMPRYTEAELALLAERWGAGDSADEIALAMGRTTGAIASAASKRGFVGAASLGEAAVELIVERAAGGWSPTRLARQHGVHVAVILRVLALDARRQAGAGRKWKRLTKSEIEEFVRLSREGLAPEEIARLTGRCAKTVQIHLRAKGSKGSVAPALRPDIAAVQSGIVEMLVRFPGAWTTVDRIAARLGDRGLDGYSVESVRRCVRRLRDEDAAILPEGYVVESKKRLGTRLRRAA